MTQRFPILGAGSVILSEAKDPLPQDDRILRFAQDDRGARYFREWESPGQ